MTNDMIETGHEDDAPRPRVRSRTFDLTAEIEAFVADVIPRVIPAFKPRCNEQIENAWNRMKEGFSDKTDSTKKLYVSKFRKALTDAITAHEPDEGRRVQVLDRVRSIVKNDPGVLEKINAAYERKQFENANSLILVGNYREIVAIAQKWLKGSSEEKRAIALMLLTGRRFIEVLKVGEFSVHAVKVQNGAIVQKWLIDFKGQTKTRGAEGTKFEELFGIPTLAPAKDVVEAIEKFRKSDLGQSIAEADFDYANSYHNPRFNTILRESEIGKAWPIDTDFSLKSLRALYAEICFKHHAPSNIHKDAYYAQILGHSEGNMKTALSYVRYYLEEKDADKAEIERKRILQAALDEEAQFRAEKEAGQHQFTKAQRVSDKQAAAAKASRAAPSKGDVAPEVIKERLRLAGVSVNSLAEKTGKNRSTVWRNLVAKGSVDVHTAIAEALGVNVAELWPSKYKG